MRADRDALAKRRLDRFMDRLWIASVKAACNICRIDEVENGDVVAHRIGAEALAHVAIEIDPRHHDSCLSCATDSDTCAKSCRRAR